MHNIDKNIPFLLEFHYPLLQDSSWKCDSIGSSNGLAPHDKTLTDPAKALYYDAYAHMHLSLNDWFSCVKILHLYFLIYTYASTALLSCLLLEYKGMDYFSMTW